MTPLFVNPAYVHSVGGPGAAFYIFPAVIIAAFVTAFVFAMWKFGLLYWIPNGDKIGDKLP